MISSNIVIAIACITIVGMVCATAILSQIMSMFRLSMGNNIRRISPDIIEGELEDENVNPDQQLLLSMVVDSNDRIRELQNQVGGLERMVMIMGSTRVTSVPTDGSVPETTIKDEVVESVSELWEERPSGNDTNSEFHGDSDLVEFIRLATKKSSPVSSPDSDTTQIQVDDKQETHSPENEELVSENKTITMDKVENTHINTPVVDTVQIDPPKKLGEEVQRDSMGRPIISADSIMKKARR